MWGYRILVPKKLRELNDSHPGVVRMEVLARSHIEEKAKSCSACQANKSAPAKAPLHLWSWATTPWEHVHIEIAGSFLGRMVECDRRSLQVA